MTAGWRAAVALLLGLASAGTAQELKEPLTASAAFVDDTGRSLAEITPGVPFRIRLQFQAAMGSVPSDLRPMAWLRQPGQGDLTCAETAAAYRASGSAALGSVDLNGPVLAVLARDGALSVLDPQRSLGSANLLAAHLFQEGAPADMVADPQSGRFLLSLPARGEVVAMTPYGQMQPVARGLDRPGALLAAASGGAWLIEEGSGDLLRLGAGTTARWPLGARALVGDAAAGPARRVAVLAGDKVVVLQDDGTTLLNHPAPGALAVGLGPDAVMWLHPGRLHLLWLDTPEREVQIALPGSFDRLAVSPQGRMVYLFAHDRSGFAVLDLALGRVVQGAETASPVAEVSFLPDTAMLRLQDQSVVGVMDLRLVRPDAEAAMGQVALGPPQPVWDGGLQRLLVPLLPEPAMLAIHADSFTGFVLDARNALSNRPPMEAMRLRGGIPRMASVLDRSLRPQGPGQFIAAASLPRPGPWQLVVSAGLGQAAFCALLPVAPGEQPPALPQGRITAQTQPDGTLRLRLLRDDGQPVADLTGWVDMAALIGNWRQRQPFQTDSSGLTRQGWKLDGMRPLVVTVSADTAVEFPPLMLEEPR